MPRLHRRIRRAIYHRLALGLLGAVRRMPRERGRGLCRGLARTALRVRGRERERARANLALVYPDEAPAVREALLSRAAAVLGENLYDALTLDRRMAAGFADVEDMGAVAELERLLGNGRGALVLTGHFGCWELLGGFLAARLGGLTVVTGRIHNPPVDRLVNDWRRRAGLTAVPRDGDLRPLLRTLRAGGVVAVLMDQNTGAGCRDIPFCGVPAPTATGFAKLALRTGAPVLPVAIGRRGERHAVTHLAPLLPADYVGADRVAALTADANLALERMLRRNPVEWVWFHERWPDAGVRSGGGG